MMKYPDMFRTRDKWVYSRKYKCPVCNEYTLRIEHDSYAECIDNCTIADKSDITTIINNNDYPRIELLRIHLVM